MNTKELDNTFIVHSYGRLPVEIVSGKGSILTDDTGKEYIDLGTGIGVNIFGVCDEEWQKAVTDQLSKFQHTSNYYYTNPCAELAEMLCERTGLKNVFFSNSGAEANECAIKAARRYSFRKYGEGRHTIITLKNSFHGRTIATLAATGQDSFHTDFGPFPDGFVYAKANDLNDVRRLIDENNCAGILFESIQGEGGVLPLTPEFLKGLRELANQHDLVLIADEVQTGNGRTGKLYGYMNAGITPDIVTTAKGLGGGLPIGATIFAEKVSEVYTPGAHGSTFGGNPVCCAGAISILARLDQACLDGVGKRSEYIIHSLMGAKGVTEISGMGLMLGISTERDAKEILSECLEKGVLVLTAKNKIRLLPPLNIPFPQLEKAIEILKEVIAK